MKVQNATPQNNFYRELSILLTQEGFDTQISENELLQVSFRGAPLCQVTENGGARYRREDVESEAASSALNKVCDLATSVAEYMRLVEDAVPLKAISLDAPYKQFPDNCVAFPERCRYNVCCRSDRGLYHIMILKYDNSAVRNDGAAHISQRVLTVL